MLTNTIKAGIPNWLETKFGFPVSKRRSPLPTPVGRFAREEAASRKSPPKTTKSKTTKDTMIMKGSCDMGFYKIFKFTKGIPKSRHFYHWNLALLQ